MTTIDQPSQGRAADILARLDRLPGTRHVWMLITLLSLGGMFELYDLFMTAYVVPGLMKAGLLTNVSVSIFTGPALFVAATFTGLFIGTCAFGYVADTYGRRTIFTYSMLWYSAATFVMAFQDTGLGVSLWRLIAGIGIGVELVTIDTYVSELVPKSMRGRAFAFNHAVQFSVVPVVAFIAYKLVPISPFGFDGWRWVAMIAAVGALAAWWLRLGLPESPRWLALHGHEDKAERIMRDLETKIARDVGVAALPPAPPSEPVTGDGKFSELLRAPYAKRTLVLSVFNLMQTIAFYGFGAWVPTLLIAKGIHVTTSLQYAFIIALANPVGPLLGILIADKMERKWQIVSAGVGIGIFMLFFASQTSPALIIFFGVLVTLFNNWISFVFHGYQAEQYPTRIRARAIGFVYSWSRVSAAMAGLLIGFFLHEGGTMGVAIFIGGAMVVMIIAVGGFGPRTLHRRLEDISQ